MEAFKYLQSYRTYPAYFPLYSFKEIVNQLSLEDLRKSLASPSEVPFPLMPLIAGWNNQGRIRWEGVESEAQHKIAALALI